MENVVELVAVRGRQWDAVATNERSCHKEEKRHSGEINLYLSAAYCLFNFLLYHKQCGSSFFTLNEAAVLELWLHHLYGVVFQVEVDVTFSDSELLIPGPGHGLIEERLKTQNLAGETKTKKKSNY